MSWRRAILLLAGLAGGAAGGLRWPAGYGVVPAATSALRGGQSSLDELASNVNYWIPLESNPTVFNDFAERVGVGSSWAFTDVYGLDEDLLSMVPEPCAAVILLFPLTDTTARAEWERAKRLEHSAPPPLPGIFWMPQRVGNACGTVAALHALVNNRHRLQVDASGLLDELLATCDDGGQHEGGGGSGSPGSVGAADARPRPLSQGHQDLLAASDAVRQASEEVARRGSTPVPSRGVDAVHHYVCFVEHKGLLYELDGAKAGPINHGPLRDGLLRDAARVIREQFVQGADSVQFNVMALVADPDGEVARAAAEG